ncbi:TetR/AcrR family transcriptional regulator [Planctomycetales bacterium ZRK34]|nr:TetR/AcrR family transcriptional regulator [Planctomycetales bacterium ZRK34]
MPRTAPEMPTRLAKAAFDCFARHGFKRVNLDQVAAAAGVTKGSLYSHYKSKKQLILAACEHYYTTYHQRVQREIADLIDPAERLHRVLALSVKTCVADRSNRVFTTELFALGLQDAAVRRSWAKFYDDVRRMYEQLLAAVLYGRGRSAEDIRGSVDLMLAAMEGIKQRAAFETHMMQPDEQTRIVEGLLRILDDELATMPQS